MSTNDKLPDGWNERSRRKYRTTTRNLGVRQGAYPAYRELLEKTRDVDVPCQQNPEFWWSIDRLEQRQAQALCRECPALQECLKYSILGIERDGVWGGLSDRERWPFIRRYLNEVQGDPEEDDEDLVEEEDDEEEAS